jgi:hypothetical protein
MIRKKTTSEKTNSDARKSGEEREAGPRYRRSAAKPQTAPELFSTLYNPFTDEKRYPVFNRDG